MENFHFMYSEFTVKQQISCSFSVKKLYILTHFMQLVSFSTPWKHKKTFGFLMFSGGIERDQRHEIG